MRRRRHHTIPRHLEVINCLTKTFAPVIKSFALHEYSAASRLNRAAELIVCFSEAAGTLVCYAKFRFGMCTIYRNVVWRICQFRRSLNPEKCVCFSKVCLIIFISAVFIAKSKRLGRFGIRAYLGSFSFFVNLKLVG